MSKRYTLLATVFCVTFVASNLFETKIFAAGPLTLTGGVLLFPITYIINDCLSEVYGYRQTRFVIWTAMALNLFIVLMAQAVIMFPSAEFWDGQAHFEYIFRADLRITAASMAAFVCGSLLNARVMSGMKAKDGDRRFSLRAVASSLAGETVDSAIFFPIAFWGVGAGRLLEMMAVQIVLKTVYEIVALPLTYAGVIALRK